MKRFAILLVAFTLAACTTFVKPQSFEQQLAYAYGSVISTRATCADYFLRQTIDRAKAENCLKVTDQARASLDAARTTLNGDMAQSQLQVALTLLLQLEASLKGLPQ